MAPPKNVRYWLCYDQKNPVGPYLQSSLKRWLAFGIITDPTPACAADQQTWITVQEIPGIHDINQRLQGDLDYRREHPYPADWKLPATERQLAYLSYLGSPCPLAGMTKGKASELLNTLVDQFPDKVKEWNNQPATAAQQERLSFLNVLHPANLTLGQAHQLLESSITPENNAAWHRHKGTSPSDAGQGVSVRLNVSLDGGNVSIQKRVPRPSLPTAACFAALLLLFPAWPALAEDWLTADGVTHKDVKIINVGPDSVTITDSDGGGVIPFSNLPPSLQKRFGYTAGPKFDPMKVVASWTSITTASGSIIPVTRVVAVDAHSLRYLTSSGAGSVEIAALPVDVQKALHYDPVAAQQAMAEQEVRDARNDALYSQISQRDHEQQAQSEAQRETQKESEEIQDQQRVMLEKTALPLVAKVHQVLPNGILADKMNISVVTVGDNDMGQGGSTVTSATYVPSGTVIMVEMPTTDVTEGQLFNLSAARNGTYTFTDTDGASRTVEKWTALRILPSGSSLSSHHSFDELTK